MLEIKNICKTLNGKKILNNLSLRVERGQICGFLGPNGSGKTTTIRIILGLYVPDSGYIANSWSKREIGFMLDTHGLYSNLSLIGNLKLYCDLYRINITGIEPLMQDLLLKFDLHDMKGVKVRLFSAGMKQKLSFIRSILHSPKLLVLDEPFNGLDPDMQSKVRSHILQLSKESGTTIFFSSHNLYEVERLCDQIYIIKGGEIKHSTSLPITTANDKIKTNLENIYLTAVK